MADCCITRDSKQHTIFQMDRAFSKQLKGIAITLMIVHHFFGFPAWYISGIAYPGLAGIADTICVISNTCVGIFAFITGWMYALHQDKSFKYSLKKIWRILVDYWVVYLLLLGIAVAISGVAPFRGGWNRILEMFAINLSGTSIMVFCWYIFFYLFLMFFFPFYHWIASKIKLNTLLREVVVLFLLYRLIVKVFVLFYLSASSGLIIWFPMAICAYLCAKYNVLGVVFSLLLEQKHQIVRILSGIGLIIITYFIMAEKWVIGVFYSCWICIPVAVVGFYLTGLQHVKWFNRLFSLLGRYSMNIWLFHSIFFCVYTREVFQPIGFLPKNPILVVCWVLLLCTVVSVLLDIIQKRIKGLISNIFHQLKG